MFKVFQKHPELVTLQSDRSDGSMRLLDNDDALANRKKFLKSQGINPSQAVHAQLIHGNLVRIVSSQEKGQLIKQTDGLITSEQNLYLTITVADCLPVFIYDPVHKVIGLVHAGWKGLISEIIPAAVIAMKGQFQSKPGEILVGIGPGIKSCHYQVDDRRAEEFRAKYPEAMIKKQGTQSLDLTLIARQQLINMGVLETNIKVNTDCTYCQQNKYFSYRREGGQKVKTMLIVFGQNG
ncbi:MAG: peptidoglycan editing factor PgeF, partial [bacterium]